MKAILTFHDVSDAPGPLSFAPGNLDVLLDAFERSGTRVVPLAELPDHPDPVRPVVALTFDDGLVSVREQALPRLVERGLPASCFVVTSRVGSDNAWPGQPTGVPTLATMDWDALAELHAAGVTVENHTATHADLRGLEPARLAEEIDAASAEIERRLGRAPVALAYPYGFYDVAAVAAAERRGLLAVTTDFAPLRGQPRARLPRLETCYFDAPALARLWGTHTFSLYLGARRIGRAAGRLLRGG